MEQPKYVKIGADGQQLPAAAKDWVAVHLPVHGLIGADLRRQAMAVYRNADRAWRDRQHQAERVAQLVWDIDELKQHLQVAKLLHAFASFRQFEALARAAHQLGAQAGGWRRHQATPQAQNAAGVGAVPQRGQKLSTCAASAGATR